VTERTLQNLFLVPAGGFLGALGLLIGLRLLLGKIRLHELLIDRATGKPSAAHLQMLMSIIVAAATYGIAIAHAPTHRALPPVDAKLLGLLVGSNVILIAKDSVRQLVHYMRAAR
jgi:hypothetical protein